MEQQIDDWETLSLLGYNTRVKFFRGCYSCKEVHGAFSTIEKLKEALFMKLRAEKITELRRLKEDLKDAKIRGNKIKYFYEEMEKWQIKTLGK